MICEKCNYVVSERCQKCIPYEFTYAPKINIHGSKMTETHLHVYALHPAYGTGRLVPASGSTSYLLPGWVVIDGRLFKESEASKEGFVVPPRIPLHRDNREYLPFYLR